MKTFTCRSTLLYASNTLSFATSVPLYHVSFYSNLILYFYYYKLSLTESSFCSFCIDFAYFFGFSVIYESYVFCVYSAAYSFFYRARTKMYKLVQLVQRNAGTGPFGGGAPESKHQRVLMYVLQRTRLSRRRMTWPLPSPFPVNMLDRWHTGRLRKRDNLLTGEGVGEREGAKLYDGQKPGPL